MERLGTTSIKTHCRSPGSSWWLRLGARACPGAALGGQASSLAALGCQVSSLAAVLSAGFWARGLPRRGPRPVGFGCLRALALPTCRGLQQLPPCCLAAGRIWFRLYGVPVAKGGYLLPGGRLGAAARGCKPPCLGVAAFALGLGRATRVAGRSTSRAAVGLESRGGFGGPTRPSCKRAAHNPWPFDPPGLPGGEAPR